MHALLSWPLAALLAAISWNVAVCASREPHERPPPCKTRLESGDVPLWTQVLVITPGMTDLLRPTREERIPTPQLARTPPLPDWVPEAGRLTTVGASDLAKNLGQTDE